MPGSTGHTRETKLSYWENTALFREIHSTSSHKSQQYLAPSIYKQGISLSDWG